MERSPIGDGDACYCESSNDTLAMESNPRAPLISPTTVYISAAYLQWECETSFPRDGYVVLPYLKSDGLRLPLPLRRPTAPFRFGGGVVPKQRTHLSFLNTVHRLQHHRIHDDRSFDTFHPYNGADQLNCRTSAADTLRVCRAWDRRSNRMPTSRVVNTNS